jgi:hypothetical protein
MSIVDGICWIYSAAWDSDRQSTVIGHGYMGAYGNLGPSWVTSRLSKTGPYISKVDYSDAKAESNTSDRHPRPVEPLRRHLRRRRRDLR